jgi:hypothetical protein
MNQAFYGLCASVFTEQRGSIPKSGGKEQKNGDWKALHPKFRVFFRGFVGRTPVLGQAARNCFGKQIPQKGLFFSINRGFWG